MTVLYKSKEKPAVLARTYGVSWACIYDIKERRSWAHVEVEQ